MEPIAGTKLLMMIVDSSRKEELEVLLGRHEILGYTEIPNIHGTGSTGIRKGSRAFPKTSSLVFTILPAERVEPLVADIREYCQACTEHMKMVVWSVQEVV